MGIERIQKLGYLLYRPVSQPARKNSETAEQITFVSWVRFNYPEYAKLMFHVPNEGQQSPQYRQQLYKMGLLKGASDLVFLSGSGALFEMKRSDWSASTSKEQKEFLTAANAEGRFACVCHGAEAAKVAFLEWIGGIDK